MCEDEPCGDFYCRAQKWALGHLATLAIKLDVTPQQLLATGAVRLRQMSCKGDAQVWQGLCTVLC